MVFNIAITILVIGALLTFNTRKVKDILSKLINVCIPFAVLSALQLDSRRGFAGAFQSKQ